MKKASWNELQNTDFINIICKNDIIFLYEIWTSKNSSLQINGFECYNFYRRYQNRRANRSSGGVVLYIRNSITKGIEIVKNHHDSIIWMKLAIFLLQVYMIGLRIHQCTM